MTENTLQYLFFSYCVGIGPITFDKLISAFGSLNSLYTASSENLKNYLTPSLVERISQFRNTFDPEKEYKKLVNAGIHVISREHEWYPEVFRHLSDPPICLYVKGDINSYVHERELYFAIVGTRNPTDYGKQIALKFSRELAELGWVIVSGLAMGIDAQAHQGALHAQGRTIAFLGCGVNIPYPPVNRFLYDQIILKGGLIISEAPPNMTVIKGLFVSRNRLISALSRGVLVAEGLKNSGSLITATCALDQGVQVFAPPAPITSIQSEAPNLLLKQGAKLVTCIDDILEEYNMKKRLDKTQTLAQLTPIENEIYTLFMQQPYTTDEVSRHLTLPIYKVLTVISTLELYGIIVKGSSGQYHIVL